MLSKGHAAPILYAAWAEAGYIPRDELLKLRELTSDLEGHPTPRLPFVDVATGSLGQGLGAGVGIALNARAHRLRLSHLRADGRRRNRGRVGVGIGGDGRVPQARLALRDRRRQRRSGRAARRSSATTWRRIAGAGPGFGWHAIVIDGHDMEQILDALAEARRTQARCRR